MNVQKLKLLALVLGMILVYTGVNAQSTAINSGNWNSAATWSGGIPGPTTNVTINNGVNVTVTASASCASISIQTGTTANTLTINNNVTLSVSGNVTINAPTDGTSDKTITLSGSGSVLECGSLTMANTGAGVDNAILNVNAGTVRVSGNLSTSPDADESDINFSTDGHLVIGGTYSGLGANLNVVNNSTVEFNGASQTVPAITYGHLTLSGSGTVTLTGVTVVDNFTLGGTAVMGGAITYSSTTVIYQGTAAQTTTNNDFPAAGTNIAAVIINNPLGVTLNGAKTLAGNLTLSQGVLTAGTNLTLNNAATRTITRDNGSMTGVPQGTANYNVVYTGNTKTTGDELGNGELEDITVSLATGQILSLNANRSPDDDISITSGTFDLGAFTLNRSAAGGGTFGVSSGATLRIGGTNSLPTSYTFTFGATSTTEYYGAAQVVNAVNYGNLTLDGTDINVAIKTIQVGGDVAVQNNLLVTSNATVNLQGSDISLNASGGGEREARINGRMVIAGAGRLVETGTAAKRLRLGEPGQLFLTASASTLPVFDSYTFDSNSVVYYSSNDAQTISSAPLYGNLVTGDDGFGAGNGSGVKTITSSLEVINSVVIGQNTNLTCQALGANADNITVGGTWLNNGTFTANDDQVIFDGTSTQELRGPVVTTFNNLRINKADPEFGMRLTSNAIVNGVLTFSVGTLSTLNGSVLIMGAASSHTGANDNNHATCAVRKIGATAFTFPVGKNGQYSPVTITAPGEAADAFQAEFIKGAASLLGPVSSPGLTNVSFCEYWVLDEIADPGSNNSISVTVSWDGQSPCGGTYISNLAGLTLAHFNGATWDSHGGTVNGGSTIASGSITRTGVSVFSPFSLGNTLSGANPLPVKFSNIKAYEKQTGIQVDWTAYDEVNVDMYHVERSADGQNFSTIGVVAATNASMTIKYGFYDANPLPGVSFYRLKNVDLDGKSGLSNIVRVSLDKSVKDIRLYPNPTRGNAVSIQSSDLARGNYKITVYNAAGQQVTSKQFNHNGGSINQPIELPAGTQSGTYMMSMENDGVRVLSRTFVVQQ